MRLTIIDDNERIPVRFGESNIYIHRLTPIRMAALFREEADRDPDDETPVQPVNVRVAQAAAVDWDGVADGEGKEVPFDKALIAKLPVEAVSTLYQRAMDVAGADGAIVRLFEATEEKEKKV